jgi:DNA-directed RNA polymerase subunit beta'
MIPYGATMAVKDTAKVKKDDLICTWDPFNNSDFNNRRWYD